MTLGNPSEAVWVSVPTTLPKDFPSVTLQDAPPCTLGIQPPAATERSMVEVQKMVDEAKEVVRSRRGPVKQVAHYSMCHPFCCSEGAAL